MIIVHTIDYCGLHWGPVSHGISIENKEIKIKKNNLLCQLWCQGVTNLAKLSMLIRGGLVVDGGLLPVLAGLFYLSGAHGTLLSGLLTSLLCSFLGEYRHLDSVTQFLLWSLPLGSWHSPLNVMGRPVLTGSLGYWYLSLKKQAASILRLSTMWCPYLNMKIVFLWWGWILSNTFHARIKFLKN